MRHLVVSLRVAWLFLEIFNKTQSKRVRLRFIKSYRIFRHCPVMVYDWFGYNWHHTLYEKSKKEANQRYKKGDTVVDLNGKEFTFPADYPEGCRDYKAINGIFYIGLFSWQIEEGQDKDLMMLRNGKKWAKIKEK